MRSYSELQNSQNHWGRHNQLGSSVMVAIVYLYFPHLRRWLKLTNVFQMGWNMLKPPIKYSKWLYKSPYKAKMSCWNILKLTLLTAHFEVWFIKFRKTHGVAVSCLFASTGCPLACLHFVGEIFHETTWKVRPMDSTEGHKTWIPGIIKSPKK